MGSRFIKTNTALPAPALPAPDLAYLKEDLETYHALFVPFLTAGSGGHCRVYLAGLLSDEHRKSEPPWGRQTGP